MGIVREVTKARSIQPPLVGLRNARWVEIRHPSYYCISIFLFLSTLNVDTINQVKPIDILEPTVPNIGDGGIPPIFHLRCQSEILYINFINFTLYADAWFVGLEIYNPVSVLIQYNLSQNTFSDAQKSNDEWYPNHWLVHDASSTVIGNATIVLENAYFDIIKKDYYVYDYAYENQKLRKVALCPNPDYIGGMTDYAFSAEHILVIHNDIHLWQSQDGKELITHFLGRGEGSADFYFSPLGTYLVGRYCDEHNINDSVRENETWVFPASILIRTDNREIIESQKDVAFTQDEQFFVTERDGIPTLVHTATDTDMLHYSIPSPMVSAAFSPNGKRIYIAAANSKIYVFDSRLDSLVADWELLADPQR